MEGLLSSWNYILCNAVLKFTVRNKPVQVGLQLCRSLVCRMMSEKIKLRHDDDAARC